MSSPQQHLDDHYGDVGFRLVKSSDEEPGGGMAPKEADSFLRKLRPVVRVGQKLGDVVKKVAKKA